MACAIVHPGDDSLRDRAERHPSAKATTTMHPVARTQNPTLSAEEIGKRFLKLIEGLESRNDLSVERIKEVTGITLSYVPKGERYSYGEPLGNGWYYMFWYNPESDSLKNGLSLMFINSKEEFGDMTPVCPLDFDHYHNALVAMGFLAEPNYGEIGELRSWHYTKFKKSDGTVDMTLSIIPQNVISGEAGRLCVKSIGTLNGR
ncbi:hypothetical protein LL965_12940 [Xanthomonas cassavae CFBP 4642]|uniref:Uncharacterized protein n=1 Tax=Xanthomonas cassavae CFBP 4642 TaxID=1219375 RepID=A0ABS8HFJ7_9XANT|nr:hypothetical protein [Xanthomonas cassavae]MCC4620953.1 hypothetical protein [Xanthomonas cassavae CFBP 4642]